MKNNITEIGPRAFGMPHIKPNIKVGDMVFVNWANGQCYKGVIREKPINPMGKNQRRTLLVLIPSMEALERT